MESRKTCSHTRFPRRQWRPYPPQVTSQLLQELRVLQIGLEGSPLGDPSLPQALPLRASGDGAVRLHGEVAVALLNARLAEAEWVVGRLEREEGATAAKALAGALAEAAELRMRLLDFGAALADLTRSLELAPGLTRSVALWAECAARLSARSDEVLGDDNFRWEAHAEGLRALRDQLRELGYLESGTRWSWPPRAPPVLDLAQEPEAWGGGEPPAGSASLQDAVRLLMLRQPLPLATASAALGPAACRTLLECRALSCHRPGELLEPSEAARLVPEQPAKAAAGLPEVFANVMLWPAGELLVAVDFEQGCHLEGAFEPVPHLGPDDGALLAALPQTPAADVLSARCGCGLHGLAALSHAQRATFLDKNPRALRFARFAAHLNELAGRASFVRGDLSDGQLPEGVVGRRFDAVLASLPDLPNPDAAVTAGGVSFAGGADGELALAALLRASARALLKPGGHLVAAAMVPNASSLAQRLSRWADEGGPQAAFQAAIFRGSPTAAADFARRATRRCAPVAAAAYGRGLREGGLRKVSEVLVLLRVPPEGRPAMVRALRAETRPEQAGLWRRRERLSAEVPAALGAFDGLAGEAALENCPTAARAAPGATLYALDWGEGLLGEVADEPLEVPDAEPGRWWALHARSGGSSYEVVLDKTSGTNLGAQVNPGDGATLLVEAVVGGLLKDWNASGRGREVQVGDRIVEVNGVRGDASRLLEQCGQKRLLRMVLRRQDADRPPRPSPAQRGEFLPDACTWQEDALHQLLGFAPPCLVDVQWHRTALPLSAAARGIPSSMFRATLVELAGCLLRGEVREALGAAPLYCAGHLRYGGEPRQFAPAGGGEPKDVLAALVDYDTVVVPVDTGGGWLRPLHEVPLEVLHLIQDVTRYVLKTRSPMRLVVLTCGGLGPRCPTAVDDGYGLPVGCSLRGMLRCARLENAHIPVLQLDTDALTDLGRGAELARQLECELELSAPEVGFYDSTAEEQNRALIYTSREVAYRGEARYLQKLDLSARNPIFPGARIQGSNAYFLQT